MLMAGGPRYGGGHLVTQQHVGPGVSAPSPFMAQLGLPSSIMALFAPRPAAPHRPPMHRPTPPPYTGVAAFVAMFDEPAEGESGQGRMPETREAKRARDRKERLAAHEEELKKQISTWNPQEDKHMQGSDPYTTLFVARLDYNTTEEDLKEAFKSYGKIRSVRVVSGPDGKSRGYGFIEFDHKHELDAAYKYGDGKIVGTRRVLADIEKGRIVKNWRPRRLGGGLGKTRVGKPSQNEPPARKVLPGDRREAERRGGERAAPAAAGRSERDGDRDLHHSRRDRRDRDADRDRDRDRDRGGYRGGDRDRDRERGGRDRERDSHRDRDRDRDYDRSDRDRDRDRRDDRDRRRPRW